MIKGIDVSRYQGQIDWKRVAASGVKFAFCKATQARSYTDPMFRPNWHGAKGAGILIGAYHYFTPTLDATAQAQNYCGVVGDIRGHLPPVIDVEDSGKLSVAQYQNSIRAWLDYVGANYNCTPIIYANLDYIRRFELQKAFPDNPFWVARYSSKEPPVPWTFWQYSSSGRVDGINGNVDLNWFRGESDEEQLQKYLLR